MIYLVPEAKACRSWHYYELGPRESMRQSGNIGIYFEQLVQATEGERENTMPQKKETRKRSQKQNENALLPEKRKEKVERQLLTQGPQKQEKKRKKDN